MDMKKTAPRALFTLFAAAAAVLAWTQVSDDNTARPPAQTTAPASTPSSLGDITTVPTRPDVPGYDRDCGTGNACVFGPAWSDDVDVSGGHNGCDTRNDILARDLTATTFKPGTRDCVVLPGTLTDPYTGATLAFQRGEGTSALVQIDHVIPLAAAWDHGASTWTPERRRDFANDPRNLTATVGEINQSKGDRTPEAWLPEHGQCQYAAAYLETATAYDLTISTGDDQALADALAGC